MMGLSARPESIGKLPPFGGWSLSFYPTAYEAGGCYLRPGRDRGSGGPAASDSDRAAAEAARRAKGQIRRYCTANRLNRLGTLTYAESCRDPALTRAHLGEFFKRLRRDVRGGRLPYVWVPQWHPGGHGLHAHFAVGQYVPRRAIEQAWPHGYTSIKLIGDLPVGSGAAEEARKASRYLARYAGRETAGEKPPGLHRYEVAQGFQPERFRILGRTCDEVLGLASEWHAAAPAHVWRSDEEKDWHGPPAVWASWAA